MVSGRLVAIEIQFVRLGGNTRFASAKELQQQLRITSGNRIHDI